MPELAEVKKYTQDINNWANGRIFHRIVVNSSNVKRHPSQLHQGNSFTIRSETRGKEQRLILRNTDNGIETSIVFNHGLVGGWAWTDQSAHDNSLLKFETTDGKSLRFIDAQRLASWHVGTWGKDRGPDPLSDYENFRQNVLRAIHQKDFAKPIAELLLNQAYFNGIGNYLRAEILHRACIDPFISGTDLFLGKGSNLTFMYQGQQHKKSDLLLALCRAIPQEVLDRGLNKYGSHSEKASFHEWLRCYDKAPQCQKDGGGRKIWYFPGNANREPAEEDKRYVLGVSSQPTSNSLPLPSIKPLLSVTHPTPSPFGLFGAAPLQIQQQQQQPHGPSGPTVRPVASQLTKELVLLSLLYKGGKIGSNDKRILKTVAFDRSGKYKALKETVVAALECFEADNDFDEAADTLLRVCARFNAM